MKKLTLLLSVLAISASISAQDSVNYTFGSVGECLFPENDKGEVEMTGVVECDGKDAATILSDIEDYVRMLDRTGKADIDDIEHFQNHLTFGVCLENGNVSEVDFVCSIIAKDGKFKYTLSDFVTERQTIHGEAKSEGPSNKLHWQRVNSLTTARDAYAQGRKNVETKKKFIVYSTQLAIEEQAYKDEYQSVLDFIDRFTKIMSGEDENF